MSVALCLIAKATLEVLVVILATSTALQAVTLLVATLLAAIHREVVGWEVQCQWLKRTLTSFLHKLAKKPTLRPK